MPISYRKLLAILQEKGENSYTLTKKNKLIGQATWKKINSGGHIDTRTIETLCQYLNCQPGDLLEYIPDTQSETNLPASSENATIKTCNNDDCKLPWED